MWFVRFAVKSIRRKNFYDIKWWLLAQIRRSNCRGSMSFVLKGRLCKRLLSADLRVCFISKTDGTAQSTLDSLQERYDQCI